MSRIFTLRPAKPVQYSTSESAPQPLGVLSKVAHGVNKDTKDTPSFGSVENGYVTLLQQKPPKRAHLKRTEFWKHAWQRQRPIYH